MALRTALKAPSRAMLVELTLVLLGVAGSAALAFADPLWTAAGTLGTARFWHTATLLPSGKVLVAGGDCTNAPPRASAELYDPVNGVGCKPVARPDGGASGDAGLEAADGGSADASEAARTDAGSGLGASATGLVSRGCDCAIGGAGRRDGAVGLCVLAGAVAVLRRRRRRASTAFSSRRDLGGGPGADRAAGPRRMISLRVDPVAEAELSLSARDARRSPRLGATPVSLTPATPRRTIAA
jgi:hypothetical protein